MGSALVGHRGAGGPVAAVQSIGRLVSLTVILGLYFLLDGVLTILFGLDHRRQGSEHWGWVVFNGAIDLVLAGIVLAGLPGAAFWAVGMIVGIDLAFGGSTLIALALAARKSVA